MESAVAFTHLSIAIPVLITRVTLTTAIGARAMASTVEWTPLAFTPIPKEPSGTVT